MQVFLIRNHRQYTAEEQLEHRKRHAAQELEDGSVNFGVSCPYNDPDAPEPIVRGDAHIQECFDIVGRCMGSSVGEQSSYPESHDTMVTGAHGKKASYVTTPTKCRPQGYGTLFRHKEEVKRMEKAEQKTQAFSRQELKPAEM